MRFVNVKTRINLRHLVKFSYKKDCVQILKGGRLFRPTAFIRFACVYKGIRKFFLFSWLVYSPDSSTSVTDLKVNPINTLFL